MYNKYTYILCIHIHTMYVHTMYTYIRCIINIEYTYILCTLEARNRTATITGTPVSHFDTSPVVRHGPRAHPYPCAYPYAYPYAYVSDAHGVIKP